MKAKKKVFVGMSGGVDSSVAAMLLKNSGYDVVGVFMRSYNVDGCAERDAQDARRVAEHIGIPFYVWDFETEYKRAVVDYMIEGYRQGITPNPDVICNKEIKFGLFLKKALALGADYVATGHYVKIGMVSGRYSLFAADDKNKDQSYFLWTLRQEQLKHCMFPLGDLEKPAIRELARKADLPTADKKDSQGVCFLGKVNVAQFLKQYIPGKKGDIVNLAGEKVGEHDGIFYYTIGQRQGLNLGMTNSYLGMKGEHETKPFYVAAKDIKENRLVVAEGEDNPALFRSTLKLKGLNMIGKLPKTSEVLARVRYRQPLSPATLVMHGPDEASLVFGEPQKFVAEGQSAVFYRPTGEMLGGGVITA